MWSHRLPVLACLLWLGACVSTENPSPPPEHQGQSAVVVPSRFVDTQVDDGLSSATSMAFAPDGRLFVCEQAGPLRIIQNGTLLSEPFLTVSTDDNGERGLLGVAFDPGFPAQPYVYVYYTVPGSGVHNRVSRFTASGNKAVAGSERVLLELDPLTAEMHNGGALHFGADGKLYVAVGENTRSSNAQSLNNLLGKLLRINKDGSIPTDNPFYATASGNNRAIWAYGLRNPFSFDIQPGTGRIFINDVGANQWEEIDDGVAGANYGWPTVEGSEDDDSRFREPLYTYSHGSGTSHGCAITGGAFYNPATLNFPAQYVGLYFFADYCGGWIRTFDVKEGTSTLFASGLGAAVDLDVGPDGNLYYLDRQDDSVHRITYTASEAPVILQQPASQRVSAGATVTFSVGASGSSPLSYQWQRNGVNISGATGASLTLAAVATSDSGARFRVRVSNSAGSVLSSEATLTVDANTPPVATIASPAEGTLYRAGDTIAFSGTGTDAEDGTLPASAFTWRVDFHHDTHLHPFYPSASGIKSGTAIIPTTGETSANVWYRIHLTVTDSGGAVSEVTRDVHPRTAKLRLETSPTGLQVTLDGQPQAAPYEVLSVVGLLRTLGVTSPQVKDGVTYVFDRWSDNGAVTHDIRTPDVDTTYTAVFKASTEPPPAGTGLKGEYFDGTDFLSLRVTRVDPVVDFRWKEAAPAPGVGDDGFSVRWTGSVVPLYSETYTFSTQANDGARLWVDGQLLIDDWKSHTQTESSGTITLVAGRAYSLRMEFFEDNGWATARLLWKSKSQKKDIIPEARLRPTPPAAGR